MKRVENNIKFLFIDKESNYYMESINLIYEESFKEYNYSKRCIISEAENKGKHIIAVVDNVVVGHARLYVSNDEGKISQVVVSKNYRGINIGSKLISELIKESFNLKLEELELFARVNSVKFYEKLGFSTFGEEFISLKTGLKLIDMKFRALLH